MSRLRYPTQISALLLVLAAAEAQGQSPVQNLDPKKWDVVQPIQGPAMYGKVQGIDKAGAIRFVSHEGGDPVIHPLGAMRSVALHKRHPAPLPRQGMVLLRSGVTIPGNVRKTDGRTLEISSALFNNRIKVSLTRVQAVRFAKLPAADEGGFQKYLKKPKEDKDLLYFTTEERVVQRSVTIDRFEDDKVYFLVRDNERSMPMSRIYGIIMGNDNGFRADPLPRPRVVLNMMGGTRLVGRLDGLDKDTCKLVTEEQLALDVVRTRITSLAVESDQLIFLTDLEPTKVQQTAAFQKAKPWLKNRSPLGQGIALGGENPRTVENGLVLTPKTTLTYDIGGTFDFFEATLCIDARSTGPAHAVFRVKNGDKVLYQSKPITRQSEPFAIKVPIEKVQQLTIEADFGKNFDFGDHCAFAEARVIKRGK